MQKIFQYFFPFDLSHYLIDSKDRALYEKWDQPYRLIQIYAVTFLTAMLYTAYSFISKSWVPASIQTMMFSVHMFVNVPILFFISLLAYNKRSYQFIMSLLAFYPIISLSAHSYISSQFLNYQPFLVEGYLGVIWIFIFSGMKFQFALVSATFSSAILIVSANFYMKDFDVFLMHAFWVFCCFSFGLLGSLIFEGSKKTIFVTQQKLQKMAVTDPLTGVFNRNKMNQIVPKEIARANRYNKTFGLLMIDVDYFKRVNDSFGHDVGDQVIIKISSLLAKSIRDNDILVRWGGEEFIVIALEVDEINLASFSDKLRKTIALENFNTVDKVTVSIGATLLQHDDTQSAMLKRADKALYQAKDQGRNRSIVEL